MNARILLRCFCLIGWLGGLLLLGPPGCSDSDPAGTQGSGGDMNWETHRSDLPRDLAPNVGADDLAALVQGNQAFTLALYEQLRAGSRNNLLFSPLSIRMAFAMVYAGARGRTDTQIAQAMHYLLSQTRLHPAYNALDLELARRNLPPGDHGEDPVEFYLANAFWGRTGLSWRQSYLDLLAVHYGSEIQSLDFAADPDEARQIINGWVEDRTRQRIQNLLPPGSVTDATAAVLTNAAYFKAPWGDRFEDESTSSGDFHLLNGRTTPVPLMHQASQQLYAEGTDYQALELSFRGYELAMLFLLPRPGQFAAFEAGLDEARLAEIVADLSLASVEVTLPRFSFSSTFLLNDPLRTLGMVVPFTGAADLSGMLDGGPDLYISKALHKTFIDLNELGVEAAAATAIVIEIVGVLPEATFTADRPFLFLIRDRTTGTILFFGRVLNPA
jgi:serpin B